VPDPSFDLVVVDPDLLARTELLNALAPRDALDFPAIEGALAAVPIGRAMGLVVGPGAAADVLPTVEALRAQRPELLVVLVVSGADADFLQQAMRAGVYDVLDAGAAPELVAASLAGAVVELEGGPGQVAAAAEAVRPGRLIIVTSAKAGEGATTVATDVATALADQGERSVALVEGDSRFGDLSLALGLEPPPLGDGFDSLGADRRAVLDAVVQHEPTGVMVLVPPRSTTPAEDQSSRRVIEVISAVQAVAQVVVVDAPFGLVESAGLLGYADEVLLVTAPDATSLKNAMVAVQILGRAGAAQVVRLVVNRCTDDAPELDGIARLVGVGVVGVLPERSDDSKEVYAAALRSIVDQVGEEA
jgi:pilus assembly protein CpaE